MARHFSKLGLTLSWAVCTCILLLGSASSVISKTPAPSAVNKADVPVHFNGRPTRVDPIENGPGLIVFEPVLKNTRDDLAEITRGCAAWLQYFVGGQPQCSKTPLWKSIRRIQTELKRQDLRVPTQDAARVAKMLGATYFVAGIIEGSAANCTLTYQLYKTAPTQPVGEPYKIAGAEVQLAKEMPRLAAQLCNDMEISPDHLPNAAPNLAELSLVGKVQSRTVDRLDSKLNEGLSKLSRSSALAGFLMIDTAQVIDPFVLRPTAMHLIELEPTNALNYAEFGWVQPRLLQYTAQDFAKSVKAYPTNYLIKTALVYFDRVQRDSKSEADASKLCARLAPANPDAWLTLGQSYCNIGDRLRKGRFYSDLTASERKEFDGTYPLWLGCAEQALKIDPLFGRAWLRASTAAAYAGFLEEADLAFEKTMILDDDRYNVYWWGLQLYQPRWLNKPEKLKALVSAASKESTLTESNRTALTRAIPGYADLQKVLIKSPPIGKQ